MPEGHTIHHLARKLHRGFAGEAVAVSSPQGRFAAGADQLDGRALLAAEAWGKHALLRWEGDLSLHFHLGLYGRTRHHEAPPPEPKGAVRLRMVGRRRAFDLIGPTACEILDVEGVAALEGRLGEDPLREDASVDRVVAAFGKTRRAIGAVLLDQSVIAGIGNVYRAELLFLHGLHPKRPAKSLTEAEVRGLWVSTVQLLRIGLRHNQIRVFGEEGVPAPPGGEDLVPEDYRVRGRHGPKRDRLWVYKRSHCKVCGTAIETSRVAARTMYHCPRCQPA